MSVGKGSFIAQKSQHVNSSFDTISLLCVFVTSITVTGRAPKTNGAGSLALSDSCVSTTHSIRVLGRLCINPTDL